MDILIPTYGRATWSQQHTARALIDDNITPHLVIQRREVDEYDQIGFLGVNRSILPAGIQTIGPTRDYIIYDMLGSDMVCMLDDDLHFAVRRDDDRTKFRQPIHGDFYLMFDHIEAALKKHPMVGIGAREGGNRVTDEIVLNTRVMRVLAFRRSYLKKHCITFSKVEVMEDFHVALSILRSGADICVLNNWVSNQAGGSGAPGGCSAYRTPALQTAAAHKLAALHHGFVRVVQKATKGAWGGGTRTDVVVSWKKARESAL